MLIKLFPLWLRPIFAPLITFPNRKNLRVCQKYAVPVIEDRLQMISEKSIHPESDWKPPVSSLAFTAWTRLYADDV